MCFPQVYAGVAELLHEDTVAVVRGRLEKGDEGTVRLRGMEISFPNLTEATVAGPVAIHLDAVRCTPPLVARLREVLATHPGSVDVHLHLRNRSRHDRARAGGVAAGGPVLGAVRRPEAPARTELPGLSEAARSRPTSAAWLGRSAPGRALTGVRRCRGRGRASAGVSSAERSGRPERSPGDEGVGLQLDVEAAPAAGDRGSCDGPGRVSSRTVGVLVLLAQRRDAAGHVSGGALGAADLGQLGPLAPDRRRQRLEVQLGVDRDDADDQAAVDVHQQRLEHALRLDAEGLGGLHAVRREAGVVAVGAQHVRHAGVRQDARGRRPTGRPLRHGRDCATGGGYRPRP